MKVFSLLLFVCSLLLFLALASYTPDDNTNANISFFDLFGLLTGDEAIAAKAETTMNWLGLLGAMLSNWLYNSTSGYIIIFLPIVIIVWAKDIFFRNAIGDDTIKRTLFFIIFILAFSGLAGSLQNFEWFPLMANEWSGSIGRMLASAFSGIIGSVGAVIVFLAIGAAAVLFGAEIDLNRLAESLKKLGAIAGAKAGAGFSQIKKNISRAADEKKKEKYEIKSENGTVVEVPDLEDNIAEEKPENPATENIPAENDNDLRINIDPTPDPSFVNPGADIDPARVFMQTAHRGESARTNFDEEQNRPEGEAEFVEPDFDKMKIENKVDIEYASPTKPEKQEKPVEHQNNNREKTKPERSSEEIRKSERFKKIVRFRKDTPVPPEQDSEADETPEKDFVPNIIPADEPVEEIYAKTEQIATPDEVESFDENEEDLDSIAISLDELTKESSDKANDELAKEVEVRSENESSPPRRPLIVNVDEHEEELVEPTTPLGTKIHDEKISYKYPTPEMLVHEPERNTVEDEELRNNARILQEKLETFKIFIENLNVTPGPVVTQYSFTPAAGIKISKIESLADDLAMALRARGIRIIAPIPGKGAVGIEIPNQNPAMVRFSGVVRSQPFHDSKFKLPMALGKTISGEVYIADLAKMPHLLIAGATGSGKSVGINTIIASFLYKMHPSNLKFVIIDPKKVELQQYTKLKNHFMAVSPDIKDTIVTNPKDAVIVLKSVVLEMEIRYDLLAGAGMRNIFEYNRKVREGKLRNDDEVLHRPMPYIVVIIDELADLMLTASKEVEEPITRLAQMARAVGIHLIVATQRPSVDVITGIIKANFPARAAYLVAQKVDSRTILDVMGAEQLLGNGDMLFLPNGSPKPTRVQNSFISTDEIDRICDFIGSQKGYSQPYMLPSLNDNGPGAADIIEDRDPLFEDAARMVISTQQGSVSMLQRRLKVGYARAGRIIDELEAAGVVGSHDGSKAREVLMESISELEAVL